MAQSQAIFDCCRGNPFLLFPLPEGDNGFALLPSCTCDWDETLALCHVKRALPKEMPLCGIKQCLSQSREGLIYLNAKSLHIRVKHPAVDKWFRVYSMSANLKNDTTVHCKGQIACEGSVCKPNVNHPCRNRNSGMKHSSFNNTTDWWKSAHRSWKLNIDFSSLLRKYSLVFILKLYLIAVMCLKYWYLQKCLSRG